jgi:hypothetical protein
VSDEASNAEYLRARETAAEYRRRGYEVVLGAPLDFLPDYCADLVVRKDDEVKVIEVKSRSSLAADPRIKELARAVDAKPGWSFELLLVAEPEKLDAPEGARSFDRGDVLERIDEAERALAAGMSEAALVLGWSACEAAARVLVTEEEKSNRDISAPGYFLDRAVFLGIMSREEYRDLVNVRRYRNAIVHGFSHGDFGDELITNLIGTVRQMMAAGQ